MLDAFDNYPHSQDAYIYACHVTKGHIDACLQIKQACQRYLDDFYREDFDYVYDAEKAEKACRFIEKMPHTKGAWAAKKLKLTMGPWQKFLVCNIFGWVNSKGLRRFRRFYLKVPRKNGKTLLAAALGNLMLSNDGEFGAEVYCGATTEKQALEVFVPAKKMCQNTPGYKEKFGITVNAKSITILANGSKFEPLIGKPGDGSSPSFAVADEYHQQDTNHFVDAMETGMGAREQPLMGITTTAGDNISRPCFGLEQECIKMLAGVFEDNQTFALIYGIDEGDDWTDPAILEKANPNFDISVSGEFLLAKQKEAVRSAAKQNAFKRKHLNVWVGANVAFLNMEDVNKCAESLDIKDFANDDCVIAVDLASKIDIVATPKVFYREIDGKMHYYFFSKFYIPEDTALDPKNERYQKWVIDEYLTATDGNEIDFNEIQQEIEQSMSDCNVSEIAYDPWRASQLAQSLQSGGANIVEFRNTVQNMSPAMYELEAAIVSGRFHYDSNPCMTWMFSNLVGHIDAKDNVYPRKQKPENKIDGVVAAIMAIGRIMVGQEQAMNIDDFLNDPVTA